MDEKRRSQIDRLLIKAHLDKVIVLGDAKTFSMPQYIGVIAGQTGISAQELGEYSRVTRVEMVTQMLNNDEHLFPKRS